MWELLESIRVQRHDFMNHLQVISGLLQLKQYDRAAEYIRKAAEDLQKTGAAARLNCPEISAALVTAELAASRNGIIINNSINIEGDLTSEPALAEVLKLMLDSAVFWAEVSLGTREAIDLDINEKDGQYLFRVGFKCRGEAMAALSEKIAFIKEKAALAKSKLTAAQGADGITVLTLTVPTPK